MELCQMENVINFINSLENESIENLQDIFNFLADFREIYDREKADLPYHINLIDELHADENAHSRIFAQLLRYEENGKFPFLEKFLNNVCDFKLSIENPIVQKVDSCGRIDIPIFDNKYVVVIENKVTDKAPDQNNLTGGQLARYIETIKNDYNKKNEEIFVVYTPKYTREPSDDCWKNRKDGSFKDDFKNRFRSISYRDKIFPWFENEISTIIKEKDIYLHSAVEQYVDYLKGMFGLRTIDKKMNMRLQELIKKEFGLPDNNPEEAAEILSEKETDLNNAIIQIQQLKSQYKKQIIVKNFEEWGELLEEDFPELKIVGDKFLIDRNCINIGVEFSVENQNFAAIIECNDCNNSNIYYGIGRHFVSAVKHKTPEILQKICDENELVKPDDFWYGWNYTPLEEAYWRLKSLINGIMCQIKRTEDQTTNR